jgi:hypothetical protein
MRWKTLITGKASKMGIIIEARFSGPSRGLVLVDNLIVAAETTVSIVNTEDTLCGRG